MNYGMKQTDAHIHEVHHRLYIFASTEGTPAA